jgi:heme A synthase
MSRAPLCFGALHLSLPPMNHWIRQIHRWVSIAFTLTVIANFVALAMGGGQQPPPYITYAPLLPLAILLFTGLYMFVLPYLAKRRT